MSQESKEIPAIDGVGFNLEKHALHRIWVNIYAKMSSEQSHHRVVHCSVSSSTVWTKRCSSFIWIKWLKPYRKKIGKRQILIMDNTSWHKSKSLDWHHFEPVYLPAYSPDFNPIERLWLRLKADWFYVFLPRLQGN